MEEKKCVIKIFCTCKNPARLFTFFVKVGNQ